MSYIRFLLVFIFMAGCSLIETENTLLQYREALATARNLHWVVETASGQFIGSATAFGEGRLLTNAHVVEDWLGQTLRVRQGQTVLPVQSFGLAVGNDVALLRVVASRIPMPIAADRPKGNDRLIVAGATIQGNFSGAGRLVEPPAGIKASDETLIARLPAMRGFSGAPVVDQQGHLVGIIASALIRRHLSTNELLHISADMTIDHVNVVVIPSDVIRATLSRERLQ